MSADNAILLVRSRKGDGFEFRIAEYGVSSEPFDTEVETQTAKAGYDAAEGDDHQMFGGPEVREIDGMPVIKPHDAQDFVRMFARSPVLTSVACAMTAARMLEERVGYVEYGVQRVCFDGEWAQLEEQAYLLEQRRLGCKVLGPNARPDYVRNFAMQDDFKCLGGPGIEDKLKGWGWSPELVAGVMRHVHGEFFAWREWPRANNLRIARVGNKVEEARYNKTLESGCCQRYDQVLFIDTDEGEVTVKFGFDHSH